MRKITPAAFLFLLIFSACRKNNTDSSDALGSWKLVSVYDKSTATALRPPTSNMDVVLTFLSTSTFAGHTLRNTLTDGSYTQNGNEIIFRNFSMTKIAEDEWGSSFLTVLTSCTLQSAVPCAPSIISVQGNLMHIVTPLRYDVTLQKI
jgi:hypothetical protein